MVKVGGGRWHRGSLCGVSCVLAQPQSCVEISGSDVALLLEG